MKFSEYKFEIAIILLGILGFIVPGCYLNSLEKNERQESVTSGWIDVGENVRVKSVTVDGTKCVLLTTDFQVKMECDWANK